MLRNIKFKCKILKFNYIFKISYTCIHTKKIVYIIINSNDGKKTNEL